MRAKSMVLIFIALVCGLVASIGISQVMDNGNGDNTALNSEMEEVYLAVADIDIDEAITAENVKLEQWPAGKAPEAAARSLDEIEGKYPSFRYVKNEPILLTKLRSSLDSQTTHIEKGYRVVPVAVRKDTISEGLVNPGDRVDIIGFFRRSPEIPTTMTRKILKNVRVFAVNAETERVTEEDGRQTNVQTVSLLVKNEQVNNLMLAVELGTLRMSLRRPDEDTVNDDSEDADITTMLSGNEKSADDEGALALAGDDTANAGPGLLGLLGQDGGLGDMLGGDSSLGAPAKPKFEMQINGPDGKLSKFVWHDEKGAPEEVFDDGFGGGSFDTPDLDTPSVEESEPNSETTES